MALSHIPETGYSEAVVMNGLITTDFNKELVNMLLEGTTTPDEMSLQLSTVCLTFGTSLRSGL